MSLDVNISEPEEFNCIELHSSLENVAQILEFEDFQYHVDYLSGKGENYVANIFRVIITDRDKNKNVSVIVKTLINTVRQELFRDIHIREVAVYREIITKFQELQNKINKEKRLRLPKCLYMDERKNKEVIVLQDLQDEGFLVGNEFNKFEELNINQVKLILSELAKFHALSFVFENEEKEIFDTVKPKFMDIIFQDFFLCKTKLRNYFFESYDMSLKLVTDVKAKKILEKVRPKLMEILRTYSGPAKYNVLCHGDLWMNNILLKKEDGKEEVCFIDFQAMRYSSPVNDILYFLYLGTTSEFRSEHFQELKSLYYETVQEYLHEFGIDIHEIYPKEEFEKELNERLTYGLLVALVELRIITTTPEDEAILKGSKIVPGIDLLEVPGEIELFKIRVNDVVKESVKNGALEKLLDMARI